MSLNLLTLTLQIMDLHVNVYTCNDGDDDDDDDGDGGGEPICKHTQVYLSIIVLHYLIFYFISTCFISESLKSLVAHYCWNLPRFL